MFGAGLAAAASAGRAARSAVLAARAHELREEIRVVREAPGARVRAEGPGRKGRAAPRGGDDRDRRPARKVYGAPGGGRGRPQQFRGARGSLKRKRNKNREAKVKSVEPPVVIPDETIAVGALAEKLDKSGAEVVKVLMLKMGVLASVTQNIDGGTARKVAEELGKTWVESEAALASVEGDDDDDDEDDDEDDAEEQLSAMDYGAALDDDDAASQLPRAPVITIMGHVDHGKTSLLDALRLTNVAEGETGGITQGVGAYQIDVRDDQSVTFIDTPGHAAFSEMRERGANVTDIVVLVVAADDGVKEQTVDSIACAKAARVPVVVAVNKIDVEGADPTRVENELMSYDLVPEENGGETLFARVSAREKLGLDDLLDKLLLQADLLDLRANPDRSATGIVVEAGVKKGLGVTATTLIQRGTLRVGDCFCAGAAWGKARALLDERGDAVDAATPSTPVQLVGWQSGADTVPLAGDYLQVVPDEQTARKLSEARAELAAQQRGAKLRDATASAFLNHVQSFGGEGAKEERKFTVLIKGDTAGSVEALTSSLEALDIQDDSDVAVASVSGAYVIAFNVASNAAAIEEERRLSGAVRTRYYGIVYDVLDDVEARMRKVLSPTPDGELVGTATVKQLFDIGKLGKVAGCGVDTGYIRRQANVRVMAGDTIKFQGKLRTLRNVKVDCARTPSRL
ncbi:hypothetical protein JL720_1550 [Aureococcus anophagefferens]|nr:hypothetical protein JL720_1550 [Aureococcus anophagefferens]